MTGRATCLQATVLLILLLTLASAVFVIFPRLDLAIESLFASPMTPFLIKDLKVWQHVRTLMIVLTDGTVATTLTLMILAMPFSRLRIVRPRILGFMILVYAVVPGVLVNFLFKQHWGRARPRDILEFGGAAHFSPPLQIADQCRGNCSFVSGETSALFTVATLMVLIFVPQLPKHLRRGATALIVAVATFGSGLRVAFGAHFASDVIFAALIATGATVVLYMIAGMDRLDSPFVKQGARRPGLARAPNVHAVQTRFD
ncbi:phosphatase PAP2 family protein [Oceaniovalibus sp. ACAM 378]|nr:phosphatase PAP2 family protein [Oceaniovalibus sp. ACAM 378]